MATIDHQAARLLHSLHISMDLGIWYYLCITRAHLPPASLPALLHDELLYARWIDISAGAIPNRIIITRSLRVKRMNFNDNNNVFTPSVKPISSASSCIYLGTYGNLSRSWTPWPDCRPQPRSQSPIGHLWPLRGLPWWIEPCSQIHCGNCRHVYTSAISWLVVRIIDQPCISAPLGPGPCFRFNKMPF